MDYADFHTHSVHSDGTKTVEEIVTLCVEKNIKYLSLTDHDTMSGLDEATKLCKKNEITFINGIELTADFNGEEIHILAYDFNIDNIYLKNFLDKTVIVRNERNKKMLTKLSELGINLDINNLSLTKDSIITRGDIANEIVNLGFAKDTNEAFFKYLAKGKVAHIKKEAFSYIEVLELIKNMGAVSSLAHPSIYSFYNNSFKSSIKELKKRGLMAIECYHSSYNNSVTDTLLGYCNRLNLLKTGGSDYHGDKKQYVYFGQATSGEFIDASLVEEFIEKVVQR